MRGVDFCRTMPVRPGSVKRQAVVSLCAVCRPTMENQPRTSDRPHFGGGFASAKIVFKALDAGDPALTAVEPPPGANGSQSVASPTGVLPTYAGDLYSEMLKLDDLRKRGLLTDKEFEQQKKKLLKKSK